MFSRKLPGIFAGLLIVLFGLAACGSPVAEPRPASTGPTQTLALAGESPVAAGETLEATTPAPQPGQAYVTAPATGGAPAPAELADILGNLSYAGIFTDKPVRLENGIAYYDDGSSANPFVRLNRHLIAAGDLNGDETVDAVALLENESSGTGRFVYLVSLLDVYGDPSPTKAVMIGDRVRISSLAIAGDQVIADLVAQGPGDPACCPSWNVRKVFALSDGQLVERSSENLSQISLADLDGTNWRLINLNAGQGPVLPGTEITLQIAGDRLTGFGGCNDYSGTVSSDADRPNSFNVGPIATTKKLCPDPVMNQEETYLTRLGKAAAWWLEAGYLELAYEAGQEGSGVLQFEPVAAR